MELLRNDLLIQGIGCLGFIMGAIALQCNKHSRVLAFKMIDEGLFGLQYLLLGGYTGAVLNLISVFRNLIFSYLGKSGKEKELKQTRILLTVLFALLGFASWEGAISILIILAKVISTLAYGTTNMKKLRIMMCVTSICWICYNITVGSIMGGVSDSINLLSAIVGMIRYDILPKAHQK